MQKHINYLMAAVLFSAITVTSCSQDTPDNTGGSFDYRMSVSINPDEYTARAAGEGESVRRLIVAAYDKATGANISTQEISDPFANGRADVSVSLIYGRAYDIVFWADADAGAYTFAKEDATIAFKPAESVSTPEGYDAFAYTLKLTGANNSVASEPISLTRATAQINIGSTIAEGRQLTGLTTTATLTCPATFSLTTGATLATSEVTLRCDTEQASTEKYPVDGYTGIGIFYVPAMEGFSADIALTVSDGSEATLSSVPLAANKRTNVYGNIIK